MAAEQVGWRRYLDASATQDVKATAVVNISSQRGQGHTREGSGGAGRQPSQGQGEQARHLSSLVYPQYCSMGTTTARSAAWGRGQDVGRAQP